MLTLKLVKKTIKQNKMINVISLSVLRWLMPPSALPPGAGAAAAMVFSL